MERRILLAEDSPTQAEHIRVLLEGEGYQVELAANGREGLQRVQAAPPDLIISDVMMPEMDGYAFCRAVKSAEATKGIPFVLLTVRNAPADILQGFEAGADNFITKPFADAALVERVRRIFANLTLLPSGGPALEVTLQVGGRRFVVSAGKAQIVEFLLSTLEDLARVNALLQGRERDLEARNRELEAANQRLQEASRHKSEFLANMSHELRTPLTSAIGFSEFLLQRAPGPLNEKQARYLTNIWSSGKHLLHLINDILDLAKVEAGKLTLQPEPLPVAPTLEDVLIMAQGLAQKKGQTVEPRIEPDLPLLRADPVRFKQVLFNLLSNAIKFTPERGRITVVARPAPAAGDHVEVRVTDTGVGIRAEDLPCLFREFVQLRPSGAQRPEGTGLGLALSKRLVEMHGGRIWAESEGQGRGSTFAFVLPFGGPGK